MNKIYPTPVYLTNTFSEIFPDLETFVARIADFNVNNILFAGMTDNDFTLTYLLLTSEYADTPINSVDNNHFIAQLVVTMNNFGPQWAKRRNIRAEVIAIEDPQDAAKDKTVYNQADNPASLDPVGTGNDEILQYINHQSATILNPNKIKAYENYVDYFDSRTNDLDLAYISKFKKLFMRIVSPQMPILFIEEEEE